MIYSRTRRQFTAITLSMSIIASQSMAEVHRGGTNTNEGKANLIIPSGGILPNNNGGIIPTDGTPGTNTGSTGSGEISTEPGLNIPTIPPSTTGPGGIIPTGPVGPGLPGGIIIGGGSNGYYPPNSPYAPWNPYNNYGSNWKPGMIPLEQSMVPGVVCPLVDHRPQVDLLAAINNLFNYVLPDDNCYGGLNDRNNNSMYGGMGGWGTDPTNNDLSKKMQEAGTALSTIYKTINDGTLDPSTLDLGAMQNHINTIVNGVDRLGRVVSNNAALGGARCGRSNSRIGLFIKSMGDLVTSLAPYALILAAGTAGGAATGGAGAGAGAAAAASAMTPAIKYVVGSYAIGSVAKVFSDMIDNNSIDMDKQDQREALLQNLCEFFRINERVKYLKLADLGQIRNINERMKQASAKLEQFKSQTALALSQAFPPNVLQEALVEEEMTKQLNEAKGSVNSIKRELNDIKKISSDTDEESLCTTGQLLADEAPKSDSFVGKTLASYNTILQKQTFVTFSQKALLKSETNIRSTLRNKSYLKKLQANMTCAAGAVCSPFAQCADIAKGYINVLNKIVNDGGQKIETLNNSLSKQLNLDPDFKEFKQVKLAVKREIDIRESTGKLVALLSNDNAAIVYGEINRQMDVLKMALMSSRTFRKSPVFLWLESSEDQFSRSLNFYEHELADLESDARLTTRSYKGQFQVTDKSGKTRRMAPWEIDKQILDDNTAVNTLSVINLQVAPLGSDKHASVCQRLTNLTLRWHTTIGHLKAQKFFCDNISGLMDSVVDTQIRNFCYGKVNSIDGTVYRKSLIEKNLLDISKRYGEKARIIDGKFRDLQCETKDAVQVMQ